MDDKDYYAFIESVLDTTDSELQAHERQALEQELADYYQCLAEQGEFDLDDEMQAYYDKLAEVDEVEKTTVFPITQDGTTPREMNNACLDLNYGY